MMLLSAGRSKRLRDTTGSALTFLAGLFVGGLSTLLLLSVLAALASPVPLGWRMVLAVSSIVWLGVSEKTTHRLGWNRRARLIRKSRIDRSPFLGVFFFGADLGLGYHTKLPRLGPAMAAVLVVALHPTLSELLLLALGWAVGRWAAIPIMATSLQRRNGDTYTTIARLPGAASLATLGFCLHALALVANA